MKKMVKIVDIMYTKPTNQGVTKSFCNINTGNVPVFACSKDNSIIGYITDDIKGVNYYSNCLKYNRNGSVGYVFYIKDKFSTNEDSRVLYIRDEYKNNLSYEYLSCILEEELLKKFNYSNKAGIEKVKNVIVEIPVKEDGSFDLDSQIKIANKFSRLQDIKNVLEGKLSLIEETQLDISFAGNKKEFKIKDLFDIYKGSSKYTHKYINQNKGVFPLYSSQTSNNGQIGCINSFDYDGECLTWTTDGIYAGKVFYRNEKFSMTTHCGALVPKKEHINSLHLPYIKYVCDNIFSKYAIGDNNKRLGKNEVGKIRISLPVINSEIDKEKQIDLFNKFDKLYLLKQKVVDSFKNIIDVKLQ